MDKTLKCNNVEFKIIYTMSRIVKELQKGNYIVFADFTQTGMTSQEILFYDKKNNRLRFMLGQNWQEDYFNIYPVTGFMMKKTDNLENLIRGLDKIYNFNIKNYDFFGYIEPKYIKVINDDFKDVSNLFNS